LPAKFTGINKNMESHIKIPQFFVSVYKESEI